MRLRLLVPFLLLLSLVPVVSAVVQDVQVSPSNPEQGDTIYVHIYADPNEEIDVTMTFNLNLPVQSGSYVVRFKNVQIIDPVNSYTVRTNDVKTLNIATAFNYPVDVINKVGEKTISDIIPSTYDIKISGYAEDGEEYVSCLVTAWSKLTINSNGEYTLSYDLGEIPPGEFTATIGGVNKQLTISPKDTTPPEILGYQPTELITTSQPIISASFSDTSGVETSSVVIIVDSSDVSSESSVTSTGFTYQSNDLLNNTNHQVQVTVKDIRGNTASKNWSFSTRFPPTPDTTPPTISNTQPTGILQSGYTTIMAILNDNRRIDTSAITLKVNGQDVTGGSQITQNSITYSLPNLSNNTLYNIELSAKDNAGNTADKQWSFTVKLPPAIPTSPGSSPPIIVNIPPEPHINGPTSGIIGDDIQLDALDSIDADGVIRNYFWYFGDETTSTGSSVSHKYQSIGEKTVKLTVTDNLGASISTTKSITIYSSSNYTISVKPGSSRSVFTGQLVTLDGTQSISSGGQITLFIWDLGDSTVKQGALTTHTYSQPGRYSVTLTVTDQRMKSSSALIEIEVSSLPTSPSHLEEVTILNGTAEFSSETLDTNVTITSTGETGFLILEYPINPFPTKPLPSNSIGLVKDISFSNPDSIQWPILVKIKVNSTIDPVLASRLGLFWFNGTSWLVCQNTGYNLTTKTVWAYMTQEETSGSPIVPAVQLTRPDFDISSISVGPQIVVIGESVVITVSLENKGDLSGVYSSELTIGSLKVPFSKEVTGHDTSSFVYTYDTIESGNFTVSVGSIGTNLEVKSLPADLIPVSVSIIADPVYSKEKFSVNLILRNDGDSNAKHFDIQLNVDNTVVDQITFDGLLPREEIAIEFNVTFGTSGEHTLSYVIDPLNEVYESNEENNQITIPIDSEERTVPMNYTPVVVLAVIITVIFLRYRMKRSGV